jgi:hypothetical protein
MLKDEIEKKKSIKKDKKKITRVNWINSSNSRLKS